MKNLFVRSSHNTVFAIIAVLGISASVLVANYDYRVSESKHNEVAREHSHYLAANIQRVFQSRLSVIASLNALVAGAQKITWSEDIDRTNFSKQFDQFTQSLEHQISGVLSMQLSPDAIVTFVSNPERNQQAIGHDLLIDDTRRQQTLDAIKKRKQLTVGPLELIQGGEAIISRQAIFTHPGAFSKERYIQQGRASSDDRWLDDIPDDFWGLSTVLIDTNTLYQELGLSDFDERFEIAIKGRHGLGHQGDIFWGDSTVFDHPLHTVNVTLPGGEWVVAIRNSDKISLLRPVLIIIFGCLLTLMIIYTYMSQQRGAIAAGLNKAKSAFVSSISHELRTPLGAILGYSQLLQLEDDILNDKSRDFIGRIRASAQYLLRIVDELLDIAKIESGNIDIDREQLKLCEVIDDCLIIIEPSAETKHIAIINNIGDPALTVYSDPHRLKQILLNLLSNAVKYNTDKGQIHLEANITHNNCIRINITDSGPGIGKTELASLFTTFSRLDETKHIEGTGLGLVITKELVEMMDGQIGVDSEKGKGSTFWVELPIHPPRI